MAGTPHRRKRKSGREDRRNARSLGWPPDRRGDLGPATFPNLDLSTIRSAARDPSVEARSSATGGLESDKSYPAEEKQSHEPDRSAHYRAAHHQHDERSDWLGLSAAPGAAIGAIVGAGARGFDDGCLLLAGFLRPRSG